MNRNQEKGFALIFTMLVLILLTVVVLSSVRTTTSGERTSGSYMDRTRAFQAAEQALAQGKALLMDNADQCLDPGCSIGTSKVAGAAVAPVAFSTVSDWSNTDAITADLASAQDGSAYYKITHLLATGGLRDLDNPGTPHADCRPYSVMGRGVGLAGGEVVLQTVVWLCPI